MVADTLSVKEAAEHASVAPETIRRWIRKGVLAAKLVKARGLKQEYRVRRKDLDAIIGS